VVVWIHVFVVVFFLLGLCVCISGNTVPLLFIFSSSSLSFRSQHYLAEVPVDTRTHRESVVRLTQELPLGLRMFRDWLWRVCVGVPMGCGLASLCVGI
jgi:hypothetical protein